MPSQLQEMLSRLDRFLGEQDCPLAQALRPGLADGELDRAEMRLGFALPQEVRDWYGWHNGVEGYHRLPNRKLLCSLGEAMVGRQALKDLPHDVEQIFAETWLPITAHLEVTLVVECIGAATNRDTPAPVYVIHVEDDWAPRMPSITAMVEVWMTMIDRGFWRWEGGGGHWRSYFADLPNEYRLLGVL